MKSTTLAFIHIVKPIVKKKFEKTVILIGF